MNVVVIGASKKPDRYSHRAQQMLTQHGHVAIPVSPTGADVLGQQGYRSVADIPEDCLPIDTVTLYVRPERLEPIIAEIIELKPRRVIFNPGTESASATERFRESGIETIEACTLVLLSTDTFD